MKKKTLLIIILSLFVCVIGFASEKPKAINAKSIIISGKIIDFKNNESLAGVKISCSNCDKSFYSDLDGNFFIYLKTNASENLTLEISQVGYSSKTLNLKEIQANTGNLQVDLVSE